MSFTTIYVINHEHHERILYVNTIWMLKIRQNIFLDENLQFTFLHNFGLT